MDWNSFAVSLFTSSVLVGLCMFMLKKSFETKLKIQLENVKGELQRQNELHARQAEALAGIMEVTYRIRNAARELTEGDQIWAKVAQTSARNLEKHQEKLKEALFTHRSILPESLFGLFHALKTPAHEVILILQHEKKLRRTRRGKANDQRSAVLLRNLERSFKEIDSIYETIVPKVHEQIGVGK